MASASPVNGNNNFSVVHAAVPRSLPVSAVQNALDQIPVASMYQLEGFLFGTAAAPVFAGPHALLNADGDPLSIPPTPGLNAYPVTVAVVNDTARPATIINNVTVDDNGTPLSGAIALLTGASQASLSGAALTGPLHASLTANLDGTLRVKVTILIM